MIIEIHLGMLYGVTFLALVGGFCIGRAWACEQPAIDGTTPPTARLPDHVEPESVPERWYPATGSLDYRAGVAAAVRQIRGMARMYAEAGNHGEHGALTAAADVLEEKS